jgi:hypothetical protein
VDGGAGALPLAFARRRRRLNVPAVKRVADAGDDTVEVGRHRLLISKVEQLDERLALVYRRARVLPEHPIFSAGFSLIGEPE